MFVRQKERAVPKSGSSTGCLIPSYFSLLLFLTVLFVFLLLFFVATQEASPEEDIADCLGFLIVLSSCVPGSFACFNFFSFVVFGGRRF